MENGLVKKNIFPDFIPGHHRIMRDTGSMIRKYAGICAYVENILVQHGSHGMNHIMRVTRLCEFIGQRESANPDILIPAALLHDIGRPQEKESGIPHEIAGARMADEYLVSIHYDKHLTPEIVRAIRTHRYHSLECPGSLEAWILSDADKLDAMGAIGIARTFMRAGEHHEGIDSAIDHFSDKLLHLRDRMHTRSAREIAEKRHASLLRFLKELEDDLDGPHEKSLKYG